MGDYYQPPRRFDGRPPRRETDTAGDAGARRYERYAGRPVELIYDDYTEEECRAQRITKNGDTDRAEYNQPLRFVLVQNLKHGLTELQFAKGMEKFHQGFDDSAGGAVEGSLRRVFLIRGRRNNSSMGYGFCEFNSVSNARAAIDKSFVLKEANKCTIGSEEVQLSFANKGVFPDVPFGYENTRGYNEKFAFLMQETGKRHMYKDESSYASEFPITPTKPADPALTIQDETQTAKKKVKVGSKREAETLESSAKKSKTSAPNLPSFPMMQKWAATQAELRSEEPVASQEAPDLPATGANAISGALVTPEAKSDAQTFAYVDTKCCYLCARELPSPDSLHEHVNKSKLHASNLKDDNKIKAAYERMKSKGIEPSDTIKSSKVASASVPNVTQTKPLESSIYRDRAAERRQEENKVSVSLKGAVTKKKGGHLSGSSSEDDSSARTYGKGRQLLQKAGWSEGKSLGTGDGIKAPIDQHLYASGVGLGHESSKKGDAVEEAARLTRNNPSDYAEKIKESAKQRYESMK